MKIGQDQELFSMLYNISKALRFCQQEEICGEAITFVQFNIMNLIAEKNCMPMSELHQVLAVDKSTTSRLIEPLVAQGLIMKEKSESDSRALLLRLTTEGLVVRDRARDCLSGFMRAVESRIPADRRQEVYQAVQLYTAALQDACRTCCC
ncbi:MAG TPA: MarR family winged helix-turn-helix transcriptional regulator [Syntrophomonadaceae bacterium]|nr:MarR family winged helix-turn-helix transcriptional regulator [Syntrophomonadaceae bacterium]